MLQVKVHIQATDPVSQVGLAGQLRPRPELELIAGGDGATADVVVVVVDAVDDEALLTLRRSQRAGSAGLVLVATNVDENDLVRAVACGVTGVVRRSEATPERLVQAITTAARGEGSMPPDLLGHLLNQVGQLQRQVLSPRGLTFHGLAQREIDVLRLVAEGYDTVEIAQKLCYSERTIKNVMREIRTRLNLRNRSHAVAYALREGLI